MIRVWACADPGLSTLAAQRRAARTMLAEGLREVFGLDADALAWTVNAFGKPLVEGHPGVGVSASHCPGAAVVAVADHRVGVDVEPVRPWDRHAASRMLHPDELADVRGADDPDREFFRYWTLKESYVKALGTGLAYPVRRLRAQPGPAGRATMNVPRATLRLHEAIAGFVVATCSLRSEGDDAEPLLVRLGGEAGGSRS